MNGEHMENNGEHWSVALDTYTCDYCKTFFKYERSEYSWETIERNLAHHLMACGEYKLRRLRYNVQ